MEKPSEDQIRHRAQEIWERNHRPDGRDDEFWHQAERELQQAPSQGDVPGGSPGARYLAGVVQARET